MPCCTHVSECTCTDGEACSPLSHSQLHVQAHGPFIYIAWFGTLPTMQRKGFGGQVMKAVSALPPHYTSSLPTGNTLRSQ